MQRVIFDSSFLMAVVERPTTWYQDITEETGKFEAVLLECVREELERIASGQGKRSRSASVALGMSSNFSSFPCGQAEVDDEITSAAFTLKAYVATADGDLINSLRAAHVKVISLGEGRVRTQ